MSEPTWPELLGSKNWDGLLEPLNDDLRRLILFCGDLCQATYDTFNNDKSSPYCGSSRYGKHDFFKKVAFEAAAESYRVSCFLYATARVDVPDDFLIKSLSREAWSRESNWIGYIAVSDDEATAASGRRDIRVAWRGTTRSLEWIDVFHPTLESIEPLLSEEVPPTHEKAVDAHHWYDGLLGGLKGKHDDDNDDNNKPKVMKGWYEIYTSDDPKSPFTKKSVRDQLLTKIKELVELYKDENLSITLTGHSLGACLAVLSAFDIVENGVNKAQFPVCAVVFGCPQVGNAAFKERVKRHQNLRVIHVRNEIDVIPRYPSELLGYKDTGTELVIDTRKSPYLKDSKNPSDWHNLQAMLHVVAGWNGKGGEFGLRERRGVALVNKSCAFLKEECLVPEMWWVEKNKGMVLCEDGEWRVLPPKEEDLPVPEF
ncbi:Phospholipase A1-IIdelta [Acorus calamus]|uniref:Phospholipase A1 n=1 Tax=Acorus calamus TaxID=4465 RepID=A0AAV9CPG3_ACOCL|nr:Phospholipase A1-IIdelta [Acorus calamus]